MKKGESFFFKVYLFLRESMHEWWGGGGRERGRQNLKQAPGSKLSAQSLMQGSNPRATRCDLSQSWLLNRLSHPDAPKKGESFTDVCVYGGVCVCVCVRARARVCARRLE